MACDGSVSPVSIEVLGDLLQRSIIAPAKPDQISSAIETGTEINWFRSHLLAAHWVGEFHDLSRIGSCLCLATRLGRT